MTLGRKWPMIFKVYLFSLFSCAFGIDTNSQEDVDNQVLTNGRQIFSTFTCKNWIMSGFVNLFLHFPGILKVPLLQMLSIYWFPDTERRSVDFEIDIIVCWQKKIYWSFSFNVVMPLTGMGIRLCDDIKSALVLKCLKRGKGKNFHICMRSLWQD